MTTFNRFIIWTHHRSGSTHLCSLLDSHTNIVCCRELFFKGEANVHSDYFTNSGLNSVSEFLNLFFNLQWEEANLPFKLLPSKDTKCVGFKLKYNQIETYPEIVDYIAENKDISIIHLIRENALHKVVSIEFIPELLGKLQKTNVLKDQSLERLNLPIDVSSNSLIESIDREEKIIEKYKLKFRNHAGHDIKYEDITGEENTATLQNLLLFLNVNSTDDLTSQYKKILPRRMSEVIKDWDDVKKNLIGTKYEHYIFET